MYGVARGRGTASLRVLDFGVILGAWLLGYLAGFGGNTNLGPRDFIPYLLIPIALQLFVNQVMGLYGPVWRYASVDEAVRVVAAVSIGTFASTFALAWVSDIQNTTLPLLTAPPVAALLILLGCGGIRFQARLFALERQRDGKTARLRTLIVGATDAGVALALELEARTFGDSQVVGFVDDDPGLVGRSVRTLRVLGTTHDLESVCAKERVDRIVIALPNASRVRRSEIEARALKTDAQVKVLAGASDTDGEPLLNTLRDLDLTDLLGREHAPVDPSDIADYLEGANVLVTGAGGSIGSEIARQIAQYRPARLLLLDRDDSLLFEVVSSLDKAEPILADIRDENRLREVFERYEPDVVFHAAAHKHVPILESHPSEAVQTNVLGTWTLAQVAADHRCRLVHISTDKAVDPCSVMGASKRVAELAVLSMGNEHLLPFSAVRFGNVLGSRGSVVPTFFRQIVEGGPVTVTDPEMTRYFMTIPEAVSLVLQAGAMADKRKVFELDMGQPVKIIELARQMIRLAGHRPDEDIKIEIVGSRPGERLHEYLHDDAEIVEPTWHPSIRSLTPKSRHRPDAPRVLPRGVAPVLRGRAGAGRRRAPRPDAQRVRRALRARHRRRRAFARPRRPRRPSGRVAPPSRADRPHRRRGRRAAAGVARRARRVRARTALRAARTPAARARHAPPRAFVQARHAHQRSARGGTRGAHGGAPRRRARRRVELVHLGSHARRPGAHRGPARSGRGAQLHVLGVGARGDVERPHAPVRRVLSPTRSRSIPLHAAAQLDGASAIMATHVFGAPCDVAAIEALGREHDIPVVFDAAHAIGAIASGTPIGSFGDAEVFSLTPTKPLVAGEGGLVATDDAALAERLRIGRDYGNPGDYDTRFAGLNARMSEFHAAMALESLPLLDESLERRRCLAGLYREPPRRRARHRVPDDLAARHEHVQGLHDPRRPRALRSLTRRPGAHAAGRRRRHPQVLRPARAPPAGVSRPRVPPAARHRRGRHERAVAAGVPGPDGRAGRAGRRAHPHRARARRSSSTRTCRRSPRSTPACSSSTSPARRRAEAR